MPAHPRLSRLQCRSGSTWTRADLIKYLGRVLPRTGRDPAAAAALLEDLAGRALRSEFEPVACLQAPEPAEVPASLLRADGRSIYQRHGGVRYATHAQLTLEQRMLALACATSAPRMDRAAAARALGADLAQLDASLADPAPPAQHAPAPPRPGRRHHPGHRRQRQGDRGRRHPAATGRGKRRRHVPARRRAKSQKLEQAT
ncbi:MAG TPA: hypothetical protein VFW50_35310 [Streptosporangiaceae bacterium]|nr:hypothetical protein [Streptosporangiaceae bacterium]